MLTVDHVYIPPPALLFFFLFEPHYKAWLSKFCQPIIRQCRHGPPAVPSDLESPDSTRGLTGGGNPTKLHWGRPNQLTTATAKATHTQVCSGVSVSMHPQLMRQEAWGYTFLSGKRTITFAFIELENSFDTVTKPFHNSLDNIQAKRQNRWRVQMTPDLKLLSFSNWLIDKQRFVLHQHQRENTL